MARVSKPVLSSSKLVLHMFLELNNMDKMFSISPTKQPIEKWPISMVIATRLSANQIAQFLWTILYGLGFFKALCATEHKVIIS